MIVTIDSCVHLFKRMHVENEIDSKCEGMFWAVVSREEVERMELKDLKDNMQLIFLMLVVLIGA